jgi:hypothetical protein
MSETNSTQPTCSACWWQEGGRCYFAPVERRDDGRSKRLAAEPCDGFWGKRVALSTVIPKENLVIISEQNK